MKKSSSKSDHKAVYRDFWVWFSK